MASVGISLSAMVPMRPKPDATSFQQWMESPLQATAAPEPSIVDVLPMRVENSRRWEAVASTDTGLVRKGNEDAYAMRMEQGGFVVCDGMGGAAAGEVASKLASETFMAALDPVPLLNEEAIRAAVKAADDRVKSEALSDPALRGMGTTLVALLLKDTGTLAYLVHAGDSRCYRFREDHLEQMTSDHSFVEEQVRSGQLTPEEALRSPLRNVITRAIGSTEPTVPDIMEVDLSAGDIYLLCSDGLTREVSDERVRSILHEEHDLNLACAALVKEAIASGGRDNITCLLVRIL